MSGQNGLTISPRLEAVLYFVGLIAIYLASYAPPVGAPGVVRTVFLALGSIVIIIKYELSTQPKPQITSHQAAFSSIALILSVAGGQLSANYSNVWEAGLALAVIGAILAAYEDLGGAVPSVPAATTPATPAPAQYMPSIAGKYLLPITTVTYPDLMTSGQFTTIQYVTP